jgi:hypothetical protein
MKDILKSLELEENLMSFSLYLIFRKEKYDSKRCSVLPMFPDEKSQS